MDELEANFDQQFRIVFDAIRQLMTPPPTTQHHKIGFNEIREKSTSDSTLKSDDKEL